MLLLMEINDESSRWYINNKKMTYLDNPKHPLDSLISTKKPEVGWILHPTFMGWHIPQAGIASERNKNLCSSVFWTVSHTVN